MSTPQIKLLWIFASTGMDAAQRRFAALVGRLGPDYEHLVCSMDGDFDAERLIPEGVAWRRVEVKIKRGGLISFGNMWGFRKLLAAERPNLIVSSNWPAVEWLMVNRGGSAIPHVHIEDPVGVEEGLDDADGSRAWGRRRAFPGRKRAFVAPSAEIERLFTEQWGAVGSDVRRIAMGVDLAAYRPRSARASEGAPIVFGATGPLIRARRHDRLLRLIATLRERGRDVRAEILGDGPERAGLEAEARSLKIEDAVAFLGSAGGYARRFAGWDAFAATGDRLRDPMALSAAMATGLPVLATKVGDASEMLADGNQLFVRPAEDESALAAAAELLAADGALRAEIGRANRIRAEAEFGLERMVERFDALFREMAGSAPLLMLPPPDGSGAGASSATPARAQAPSQAGDVARQAQAARVARASAPTVRPMRPQAPGQLAALKAAARAVFDGPDTPVRA